MLCKAIARFNPPVTYFGTFEFALVLVGGAFIFAFQNTCERNLVAIEPARSLEYSDFSLYQPAAVHSIDYLGTLVTLKLMAYTVASGYCP